MRLFLVLFLSSAAAVFGLPRVFAQIGSTALAFERAARLRHGINLSHWFAQEPNNYSAQRLASYITADDLGLIYQLGFDHVRLPIDPVPLVNPPVTNRFNANHLALLDKAVNEILDNHLNVVLDVHPEDSYEDPLGGDQKAQQAFVQFWNDFATHYASTDPERVFFEILNEPKMSDVAVWSNLEGQVVSVIRKAAPRHTIIATGGNYSGLVDLLKSQPVSDLNVIYTFHDYQPDAFTQQGATWGMKELKPLSQIPYPSTPENIVPMLEEETDLASQFWLNEYGLDQWNSSRVASQISFARRWSERYRVPVWCGEFGVIRDTPTPGQPNPGMRAAWLHDMRVALEQSGIGWAMWDYRANFGLVTDVNGRRVADEQIVNALGIRPVH